MSWFLLLPLASIAGYVFALARHTSVRWSVAPITVLSAIVLVLFFSDFVSLLRPVSLCLTFDVWRYCDACDGMQAVL